MSSFPRARRRRAAPGVMRGDASSCRRMRPACGSACLAAPSIRRMRHTAPPVCWPCAGWGSTGSGGSSLRAIRSRIPRGWHRWPNGSPPPARWPTIRGSTSPISKPTSAPATPMRRSITWCGGVRGVRFVWIMGADNLRAFIAGSAGATLRPWCRSRWSTGWARASIRRGGHRPGAGLGAAARIGGADAAGPLAAGLDLPARPQIAVVLDRAARGARLRET